MFSFEMTSRRAFQNVISVKSDILKGDIIEMASSKNANMKYKIDRKTGYIIHGSYSLCNCLFCFLCTPTLWSSIRVTTFSLAMPQVAF